MVLELHPVSPRLAAPWPFLTFDFRQDAGGEGTSSKISMWNSGATDGILSLPTR